MRNKGELLLYQTPNGRSNIEISLVNGDVWLSKEQMAELFQCSESTISRHINDVYDSGELDETLTATCLETTQSEDDHKAQRNVMFYNLDMIVSVGYRVNSHRGAQFRMWATSILKEYLIKGFALNDELLKRAGNGNYFDDLLVRIRDIRSSEKVFYRKILEIYALSIDYDPRSKQTQGFFKTIQDKMHYAVHGRTADEVIYDRADAREDNMGLKRWIGDRPDKADAEYAKNYLSEEEAYKFNLIVSFYLDFAELQAQTHKPMYMKDWIDKLDEFLKMSEMELLTHAGTISSDIAKQRADMEYDKFVDRTRQELSPIEQLFIKRLEEEQKKLRE